MNNIANLSVEQRNELFHETAVLMNTSDAIVEKDFWVVWILGKVFADDKLRKILRFKGGTSLSKVFDLIGRFSEDIDLILDWTLLTEQNPKEQRSNTQQVKYNKKVNKKAEIYIESEILPVVANLLSPLCLCEIDEEDKLKINIVYPSSFSDEALLPKILLEIGPLASWMPSQSYKITSFAAQEFPEVFTHTDCIVEAVVAERTFWEKATILHQEANRGVSKNMPLRHSRHYYDMAIMAQSKVKNQALSNLNLLDSVVEFKKKFYRSPWAKYEDAKVGTLKLLPPEFRYKELKSDYSNMRSMIFDKYLEFDEIILILKELENEVNSLGVNTRLMQKSVL
ncbi:MAG: nucleotidyl transferase AbiEii/AbiGii toxin family protein [Candidatus Thioglobus sp.]|nr:nucleotidyl transferase AbiEii/AbiGii toxin family protein [Candidatus Thioglobus sp.]